MQRNEIQSSIDSIQSAIARGASREAILLTINMSIVNEAPGSNVEEKLDPYLAKVTELLIEKAEMLQKVGEGHPSIKAIDGRIELLRQFYRREAGDTSEARDLIDIHLESLHERIKGLDVKIANLNDRFESEQEKAKALATEQLEDQALKAEGEHLRGFLDVVLEKVREIDLVKDQGTLLATVTQRASNGMQIGPDFAKFLGLGGAVGFLAALGLSFLMEMADKGFRNPDEITRHLSLPVLGHVPELDAGRDWKVVKDGVVDRSVATHHRPKSRLAESYRAVRAALFFGMRGQNNRVLQVTSADPGDGKSTLAANVAAAIATSGKKCLLMDGDLRRPRVHAIFGIHNEKGVSSVVRDGMDVPDCIQTSAIENLDIMTVGPRVDNPAELLLSPRFTELVAMVRERYDFVLIDTPPVLAVTDPAAVAAHVDGVILVVRITKRSRPHAKRACETLDLIGARVLGVVVNGVGEGSGKYGAGYGYGYSYGGYGYNYGPGGYGEKGKNYSDSYFAEKATRG
jgi:capsular exopolysaccharide synthesis family protein